MVSECVVCMLSNPEFWAWTDCTVGKSPGHQACVCWTCMVRVVDGKGTSAKCPWCRAAITTIQKVTRELIEAGASSQDALESVHVSAQPVSLRRRGRPPRPNVVRDVVLDDFCMDCGMAVHFPMDICHMCFAAWRHGRELQGHEFSGAACWSCGARIGSTTTCRGCYAYRREQTIRFPVHFAGVLALRAGLSRLRAADTPTWATWAEQLGAALIQSVELRVGNTVIFRDRE
jgi:hypothetical protein